MKKKLLTTAILLVAAVALVVTTMLATFAYLTSTTAVSNTFTVGNITIQMFESKVNSDGTKVNPDSNVKDADGNSYHLVPGASYIKDPTIYVAPKSDDCYLFIKVRNQLRPVEDGYVNGTNDDALTMREQLKAKGWIDVYHVTNDETIYCYVGTPVEGVSLTAEANAGVNDKIAGVVKYSENQTAINLFDTFTIDKDANLNSIGGAKVIITAFAIQGDINVGGDDSLNGTATLKELQKLWNIVSGEIEFETVIIPNSVINATTNVINSPDLQAPSTPVNG